MKQKKIDIQKNIFKIKTNGIFKNPLISKKMNQNGNDNNNNKKNIKIFKNLTNNINLNKNVKILPKLNTSNEFNESISKKKNLNNINLNNILNLLQETSQKKKKNIIDNLNSKNKVLYPPNKDNNNEGPLISTGQQTYLSVFKNENNANKVNELNELNKINDNNITPLREQKNNMNEILEPEMNYKNNSNYHKYKNLIYDDSKNFEYKNYINNINSKSALIDEKNKYMQNIYENKLNYLNERNIDISQLNEEKEYKKIPYIKIINNSKLHKINSSYVKKSKSLNDMFPFLPHTNNEIMGSIKNVHKKLNNDSLIFIKEHGLNEKQKNISLEELKKIYQNVYSRNSINKDIKENKKIYNSLHEDNFIGQKNVCLKLNIKPKKCKNNSFIIRENSSKNRRLNKAFALAKRKIKNNSFNYLNNNLKELDKFPQLIYSCNEESNQSITISSNEDKYNNIYINNNIFVEGKVNNMNLSLNFNSNYSQPQLIGKKWTTKVNENNKVKLTNNIYSKDTFSSRYKKKNKKNDKINSKSYDIIPPVMNYKYNDFSKEIKDDKGNIISSEYYYY